MSTTALSIRWLSVSLSTIALGGILVCSTRATADSLDDWQKMKVITPRGYVCGFADAPLKIDGRPDEPAWRAATWTEDFVDIEGSAKPKPRLRTKAKMLWDNEYFYVAVELDEPHVWGTLKDHDSVIFQDNDFEVFIDPDGDNHEYYELELNALNTTWDLFLDRPYKDGGKADNGWEIAGLKSAVRVRGTLNEPTDEDAGWTVELAIPWKALATRAHKAAPPRDGDQWRIDFSRVEWQHEIVDGKYRKVAGTREDNWVWSPPGIIDMHRPERWGFVQFSTEPPDKPAYAPDSSLAARDLLMELYHRQKSFHDRNQRWAASLKELDWSLPAEAEAIGTLEMLSTDEGFEATLIPADDKKTKQQWHVRQDSRLWMTADDDGLEARLEQAGDNRPQIEKALADAAADQRKAMRFLVLNMPERDLTSLSAKYLLENLRLAYQALSEAPWKDQLPQEVFFNDVLPYASINESRDDKWRKDFYERFAPLVKDCKTPGTAGAVLNQKIFSILNVRYSTGRQKADQCPSESIKSGLASCTGLSVLLIDACRAVGVPARFVGTPLWADKSGNHSWVEVWDNGWHFTGAAEPSGDRLDEAWFLDRASAARRDHPLHAIYASSFRRTPQKFPLVWDRGIDYVSAVNVTDRYVGRSAKPPEGTVKVMFRLLDREGGSRVAASLKVFDAAEKVVFEGMTNDERFDANDHLSAYLRADQMFRAELRSGARVLQKSFKAKRRDQPLTWLLDGLIEDSPRESRTESDSAVAQLAAYLKVPVDEREPLDKQPFATAPLSREDAASAEKLLWQDHEAQIRATRAEEMNSKVLSAGELKMPFAYQIFGEKPAGGRSLFISMHGGGGAPKRVNDQRWENQKRLYQLDEGVYVAPRAPTDTWDLWHQSHIDDLFDRLIENLIVFENVDPDRVYLMGYSAGGDGVYQLAPRMADRFAAASMMAGHPNETSPLGLRNLPFAIHVGALDSGYNRNKVAEEWKQKLDELHENDPDGYEHVVELHAGKGHWMDREDAAAIPWMAKHSRNRLPKRIVWKQDDVTHTRFYWLAVQPKEFRDRSELVASRDGQRIDVQSRDVDRLTIRLSDEMLDLDQPVTIASAGKTLFDARTPRTIAVLAKTLSERGDRKGMFSAELTVDLSARAP